MSRSPFGWSLPPGVTTRMIDDAVGGDEQCEVCGLDAADCQCPECPVCSEVGNPRCYAEHGLKHEDDEDAESET
jgi:hypothetical protein